MSKRVCTVTLYEDDAVVVTTSGGCAVGGWWSLVRGVMVSRNRVRPVRIGCAGAGLVVCVTFALSGALRRAGLPITSGPCEAAPPVRSLPVPGLRRQTRRVQTGRPSDHGGGSGRGQGGGGRGRGGLPAAGLWWAAAGVVEGPGTAGAAAGRDGGAAAAGPGQVPGVPGVPRAAAGRVPAPARVRRARDRGRVAGGRAGRRVPAGRGRLSGCRPARSAAG